MRTISSTLLGASLLAVFPASGATLVTSAIIPAAGDYASDSVHVLDGVESSNQLRVRNSIDAAGQSFTLGTIGDADYALNSFTFLASGTGGSATESATGLTIRLYEGAPIDSGAITTFAVPGSTPTVSVSTPIYEFTFTSGTFNTTAGQYVTFQLSAAETATIGNLTAGTEYAFAVGVNSAVETTDIDFRFLRDNLSESYLGGDAFLPGRVLNGVAPETISGDAVFVVNATVVPEPSSAILSLLGGLALLARRRRA